MSVIGEAAQHFVQQKKRVPHLRLGHLLQQLTGHGSNIGSTVATDLRLVAHPAQRHAHKAPVGRAGNRLTQ